MGLAANWVGAQLPLNMAVNYHDYNFFGMVFRGKQAPWDQPLEIRVSAFEPPSPEVLAAQ